LVGGGSDPRPGEISLAHHGVLFLDELPEWERRVLEALREPLESGVIHISRAARQSTFPAQFQLVAAMNPCPCGWLGHASGRCHCTPDRIARYRSRVSGPLLDRIDLAIDVPAVPPESLALNAGVARRSRSKGSDVAVAEPEMHTRETIESSATVRVRVEHARERQRDRQGKANARLLPAEVAAHCVPEANAEDLLARAMTRLALSARAYHRVLKVARTIADLTGCERINTTHVAEAIGYRRMDAA
jgi:magnesium chelatase family protein